MPTSGPNISSEPHGPMPSWGFEQADRVASLTGSGLLALGDRLDPEVRQTAGRALQKYGQTSRRFHTLDHNLERVGGAIKDAGFDL